MPESSLCKKKCLFFVNRVSSIYRREKHFVFGSVNTDLREYSETNAAVMSSLLQRLASRCNDHLQKVRLGTVSLVHGVDLELVEIKIRLCPLMLEIGKILQTNNKASRSAPTAFFLTKLLESGLLDQVFVLLDWAAQVLVAYDKQQANKLLLHQQVLHECLLAPMNLLSLLISGEFLKRGEIKFYLQPNELSPVIAIYKLRLFMMQKLF